MESLFSSLIVTRMMKSRRMTRESHGACERREMLTNYPSEHLKSPLFTSQTRTAILK
jgi:hypothetical protein